MKAKHRFKLTYRKLEDKKGWLVMDSQKQEVRTSSMDKGQSTLEWLRTYAVLEGREWKRRSDDANN